MGRHGDKWLAILKTALGSVGWSPGLGYCGTDVCSWARQCTLIVPSIIGNGKLWKQLDKMLGVVEGVNCDGLAFIAMDTGISSGCAGQLAPQQAQTLPNWVLHRNASHTNKLSCICSSPPSFDSRVESFFYFYLMEMWLLGFWLRVT